MALRKQRAPSFSGESSETVSVGEKEFKVKKAITLPIWKWSDGETKVFTILEKIHDSFRLSAEEDSLGGRDKKRIKGDKEMPPAKIAPVRNLVDGGLYTLIFGAGLFRDITENYKGDSYVSLSFKVTRLKAVKTSKGYNFNPYSISEVETPGA
jgi:hypothetical protein